MLLLQTTIRGQGFLCVALAIGRAVNAKLTVLINVPPRKSHVGVRCMAFRCPSLERGLLPCETLGSWANSIVNFRV